MNLEIYHLYLIVTFFVSIAAAVILTLLWVRKLLQKSKSAVYKVVDSKGIESLESVKLEGIDFWLHIRGRNRDNPILLFLHGGPGASNIGYYDAIQRPWENYFTVIQWDQRQAGKSRKLQKQLEETISHEQYIKDAEEMVKYIRSRFNHEKIFLMATSYGTYLSMHLVKQHPTWFYAYVAVGQVTTLVDHTHTEYNLLLDYAKRHNHTELVSQLNAIHPYPDPNNLAKSIFNNIGFLQNQESRFGKCYPDRMPEFISIDKWFSPHYTLYDNIKQALATHIDGNHPFANDFVKFDLPKEVGVEFKAPIFFFTGVNDFHIPHMHSDAWFKQILAPYKEHVLFEDSAHAPYVTEPGEFLMALVTKVLPLAKKTEVLAPELNESLVD